MDKTFKDWLVEVLRERDLTYGQLGNQIGVSHGAIGGWVRGKYLPDPSSLRQLAEITGTDAIWLFKLVGYIPKGDQPQEPVNPKVAALMRELESLPDEVLDLLFDQIRHVLRPRAALFKERGENDEEASEDSKQDRQPARRRR